MEKSIIIFPAKNTNRFELKKNMTEIKVWAMSNFFFTSSSFAVGKIRYIKIELQSNPLHVWLWLVCVCTCVRAHVYG